MHHSTHAQPTCSACSHAPASLSAPAELRAEKAQAPGSSSLTAPAGGEDDPHGAHTGTCGPWRRHTAALSCPNWPGAAPALVNTLITHFPRKAPQVSLPFPEAAGRGSGGLLAGSPRAAARKALCTPLCLGHGWALWPAAQGNAMNAKTSQLWDQSHSTE